MAIRYDQKTKDEVVAFIQNYNEEHGRGGQSAAQKKWNLNPITIKAWLEKAGVGTPGKSGKKKKRKGKAASASTTAAATTAAAEKAPRAGGRKPAKSSGGPASTLQRMMDIQKQIDSLSGEYDKLKGTL